jgi:hypothetical protein
MNAQINKLTKQLNKTTADVNHLYACFNLRAVIQYGQDPAGGTFGYVWHDPSYNPSTWLTTGLDFRESGNTSRPDMWVMAWTCAVS